MIKVENIGVSGVEHALRGMRNPLNSWDKSDPVSDLKLARKLVKAGTDHRKFLRMITVYMDITAPLYWWKEFDTYKVGTVANSCSTMHSIHKKEFELDDFSHEHLKEWEDSIRFPTSPKTVLELTVKMLNKARDKFLESDDKFYWYQMIQLLPSSYNQKRTVMLNFEVLLNIYNARKSHKLDEWREFCEAIEEIPLFKPICLFEQKENYNGN